MKLWKNELESAAHNYFNNPISALKEIKEKTPAAADLVSGIQGW